MSDELESALAEDEVNLARLRARMSHMTEAQLESRLTSCGGDVRYEHWSNCDLDPYHDGECLSGIEYAEQLRAQLVAQSNIIQAATALVEYWRTLSGSADRPTTELIDLLDAAFEEGQLPPTARAGFQAGYCLAVQEWVSGDVDPEQHWEQTYQHWHDALNGETP